MEWVRKILLSLVILVLGAGVGLRWLFTPEAVAVEFGISLDGIAALNQVRGDIGGIFVGLAAVVALGMLRREPRFLQAVAIGVGCVIFGRLTGLLMDGIDRSVIAAVLAELAIVASLLWGASAMQDSGGN
jgi:hypothetical protein